MHGYLLNNGAQRTALLFQRLIGASLSKRNRKSMRMQTVYSRANKPFLTAANSCRYYYDVRPI
ncbi:hypothetical protein GTN27_01540 [Ochrobactrum sp. EEELCW01]|nr:hypothetical protein GTN27_01540 [Ochrobactrum sp. EEELCW01]